MPVTEARQLILASSSPYRKALLQRLGLPFMSLTPDIDESQLDGEPPEQMVARLAQAKAEKIAASHSDALIIGCDQIALQNDHIFGKPGDHAAAVQQLLSCSGKRLTFLTAVSVLDSKTGVRLSVSVPCQIVFRQLELSLIERYLLREQPYDCCGAFKSEGLGIALIERIDTSDPTSLTGLPLIQLCQMLERLGMPVI